MWNRGEALEDWSREGGGLAGAGLCDAAQIAPTEHRRDGLELNRRGRLKNRSRNLSFGEHVAKFLRL
jgi:hypothetical protein